MRELELIYDGVNPGKVAQLEGFREQARLYSEVYKRLVYKTWSLGEGEDAVVFLPGGMGHGEVWFPQMLDVARERRAIALSLPECRSLHEAADGILFTLGQMGVRRAVVAGYSLGGLIAQLMARKDPESIPGMLLCLTGAPIKGLPADIAAKWVFRRKQRFSASVMNFNNAARMAMAEGVFHKNCPPGKEIEMDFWRAFIEDSYCNHIYLKQYVNLNYQAQPDLYKEGPFEPGDMAGRGVKVSILFSDGDDLYGPETPYLFELYPDARRVDLGGAGQFAMLVNGGQVTAEVEALADLCFPKKLTE